MKRGAKQKKSGLAKRIIQWYAIKNPGARALLIIMTIAGVMLVTIGAVNGIGLVWDKYRFMAAAASVDTLAKDLRQADPTVTWEVGRGCSRGKLKYGYTEWGCGVVTSTSIEVTTFEEVKDIILKYNTIIDKNTKSFSRVSSSVSKVESSKDLRYGVHSVTYNHSTFGKCSMNYTLPHNLAKETVDLPSPGNPVEFSAYFKCADEARHPWFQKTSE